MPYFWVREDFNVVNLLEPNGLKHLSAALVDSDASCIGIHMSMDPLLGVFVLELHSVVPGRLNFITTPSGIATGDEGGAVDGRSYANDIGPALTSNGVGSLLDEGLIF